jgi:hypothetical protein
MVREEREAKGTTYYQPQYVGEKQEWLIKERDN